ncbi:hypothetical protein BV898_12500 [Hypsibius exemplaris]|uniref:Potassium channel domain-containing protein n=1 Tax=Hypsibius exemplaris TaxID=2072580 RepID=A0A1W0WDL2_HYPEX|nr:hypothetical protein BV898_12500 [Hypsibius exemplaris]
MADIVGSSGAALPPRKSSHNELHVRVKNGHANSSEAKHLPRRGSIRVLLSETSKALGLPFEGEGPETPEPPANHRMFPFQRQATTSSLNVPHTPNSVTGGSSQGKENYQNDRRCCKHVSRLFAHSVLIVILGCYVMMGTLLFVYIIGPEEAQFEAQRTGTSFDVDEVMGYLKTVVLKQPDQTVTGEGVRRHDGVVGQREDSQMDYTNLDNFRTFLKHRVKMAGVYVNKRDFSAVSGILYSVSVIGGIGIGNPPRTLIGKAVTFSYCFFGMPLYFLFLYVIGDDVGKLVAVLYHQGSLCSMCRHHASVNQARQFQAASGNDLNEGYRRIQACVPVSLMLVIIAFYVMLAVLMFGLWEDWDAVNSIYFCVMTLMSVGLIDDIPGDHIDHKLTSVTTHIRRSLVIFYIIFGWLLVSALFHAVTARIAMSKKKKSFKLTQQSRTTSMIFRPPASSSSNF